jgi:hypothetical protein
MYKYICLGVSFRPICVLVLPKQSAGEADQADHRGREEALQGKDFS